MRRRNVCISLDKELVKKLDEMKKNLSRSSYVEQVLMNTLGMQWKGMEEIGIAGLQYLNDKLYTIYYNFYCI